MPAGVAVAAVLEKHLGVQFSDQDIYVNVAGGMRIVDVGVERPPPMALYSARSGKPLPSGTAVAEEVRPAAPPSMPDRKRST